MELYIIIMIVVITICFCFLSVVCYRQYKERQFQSKLADEILNVIVNEFEVNTRERIRQVNEV